MNNPVLKVDGIEYDGWMSVNITKSIDYLAGAFSFTCSDKNSQKSEKWEIRLGNSCTVEINKQVLITGYIEDVNVEYDDENHVITFSGRDKLGDLCDCSWPSYTNEWKNQRVRDIIDEMCDAFGIPLIVDRRAVTQANKKIETFKIDEGETIAEMISRLCKDIALLPITYGDGKLILTQAGSEYCNDNLSLGSNIKSGSLNHSNRDRFSVYTVKGQGPGNDNKLLTDFIMPAGTIGDDGIDRWRPVILFTEGLATIEKCQERASWEARIRAGKSRTFNYEVASLTQSNGDIWPLNALITVYDPFLGLDDKMLINSIEYNLDVDIGSSTILGLISPKAYELLNTDISQTDLKYGFDPLTMQSQ